MEEENGASEVNGVRPGTARTMVRVRFVNGVERVLPFQEKEVVLLWLGEAEALVTREEAEKFWNIRPLVNNDRNPNRFSESRKQPSIRDEGN